MKKSVIIFIVLFFSLPYIFAQNLTSTDFNSGAAGQPIKFNTFRNQAAIMSGTFASSKTTAIPTDGSVYLFDSWKNKAIIQLSTKSYTFSNINFNIEKETFMSQIEGDSLYIFDFKNINKVVINGKEFKSFFSPLDGQDKIFQVIYENTDFSILKKYNVKIIESSPDPMLNRSRNKIVKNESYFTIQNNNFTPFKLKKKFITQLLEKNTAVSMLDKYVKSNNLSYKDENDLKKIFDYGLNIK